MRAIVLTTALALALAGAAHASPVEGLWRTPVDDGVVRIEACGAAICGRVVSSARLKADPDQRDAHNHDPALRARPIKNLLIFQLNPIGPDAWGDGVLYNPKDGGAYKGTVRLADARTLKLEGCIVKPFCQTQTWTRIGDAGR